MNAIMENEDWENLMGEDNQIILDKSSSLIVHSEISSILTVLIHGKCSAIKVLFLYFLIYYYYYYYYYYYCYYYCYYYYYYCYYYYLFLFLLLINYLFYLLFIS